MLDQLYRFSFQAMGSPCQLSLYANSQAKAKNVFKRVVARVNVLEKRYSRYRSDSLISHINQSAGSLKKIPIDPETAALLSYAEQCYIESDGLFDPTSGVLRKAWKFTEGQEQLPKPEQIEQLLALINWRKVIWETEWVFLEKPGMQLDFGGIVKEYAADSVASICFEQNIQSGFINMGGDIHMFGMAPSQKPWPVSIQDPFHTEQAIAQLHLKHGGVASSGDYQRYIEIEGKRYSHMLNPKTGWPVRGLAGVSVVAEHCVVAGSLATIAMLKGEHGVEWLRNSGAKFVACTDKREILKNI